MSLYGHLGLQQGADSQDIRRAYLKLSKTEHPDKGGSEERFNKIQEAYEVLSDDQKRAFYDQTGQIPGSEQNNQGHGVPFDMGSMFSGMFGGGMPFGGMGIPFGMGGVPQQHQQKRHKGPPKVLEVGLTLHDLFFGKTSQMKFKRQKFCDDCKGVGATSFSQCGQCNGSGVHEQRIMFGPGMQAVQRGPCGGCSGEGRKQNGPCNTCRGMKFKTQEKMLSITIEPGMKAGDIIEFRNESSDQHEYEEPSDVHIVLQENDDNLTLTRLGDDLSTVVSINLASALLGTEYMVQGHPAHPTGLTVAIPAGVMRGDVVTVVGEGMPRRGTAQRGNLQVTVSVDVTADDRERLKKGASVLREMFA
jgi:DnaJ-class molecular chaperone